MIKYVDNKEVLTAIQVVRKGLKYEIKVIHFVDGRPYRVEKHKKAFGVKRFVASIVNYNGLVGVLPSEMQIYNFTPLDLSFKGVGYYTLNGDYIKYFDK